MKLFIIFLLVSFICVMGFALKLTIDTSMIFKSKNADLIEQNKLLTNQNKKLEQTYNKRESRRKKQIIK